MDVIVAFIHVILFITTYEAFFWAFTMNRHARWMQDHSALLKEEKCCSRVTYRITKSAAFLTSILSFTIGVLWLIISSYGVGSIIFKVIEDRYVFGIVFIMVQLSYIHFFAILARCIRLPRLYWPLLSKGISITLVKFFDIKEPE